MTQRILATLVAAAGLFIEVYLIERILTHPAAGPEQVLLSTRIVFIGLASLPFLVLLLLVLYRNRSAADYAHWLRCSAITVVVGALSAFVALRQFGHSTLAILLLGYLGQWITIAISILRRSRLQST